MTNRSWLLLNGASFQSAAYGPPPQKTGWLVRSPYCFVLYGKIGSSLLVTASPRLVSRPARVISILFAEYENCSVLVALVPSVWFSEATKDLLGWFQFESTDG